MFKHYIFVLLFFYSILCSAAVVTDKVPLLQRAEFNAFIDMMQQQHHLDKNKLQSVFKQVAIRQDIIDLITRPAEKVKPWYEYKQIFLTSRRIDEGVVFWKENAGALEYAREVYGVDPQIIVAIIGVETFYGRIMGKHRVIDALTTLAFDYPPREKFFRSELKHFLILCHEQGIDPLSLNGSYAGAMGYGQFMPSSYRNYAVNFDGEDTIDIWENKVDAIGSAANYFKEHGWIENGPVIAAVKSQILSKAHQNRLKPYQTVQQFEQQKIKIAESESLAAEMATLIGLEEEQGMQYWLAFNNFYTITRYNHSPMYALAVYRLSQEIARAYAVAD